MDATDIKKIRLNNHQLLNTSFKTPQEMVSWLGAVQAQDFNMAKWGVGLRLPGVSDRMVEDALNKGEIVRTHILRPTWHFVAAEDIHWMLRLSSPRVKLAIRSSDEVLELTPRVIKKAGSIIEKALGKGVDLTRQEIRGVLSEGGVDCSDSRRVNHIMYHAELDGIVCNGIVRGKNQTYALLEEKVPVKGVFDKEESLAKLTRKYFQSHSPATLYDYVWWSGLSISEARLGIELIKDKLQVEVVDKQTYFIYDPVSVINMQSDIVHFLPAFDEYFVSYKDRTHIVSDEHYPKIATKNGIFRPMLLVDGHIVGKWKRTVKKLSVGLEYELYHKYNRELLKRIEEISGKYALFNLLAEE